MVESDDIKYMRRCLDLASGAEGLTYPNPMVGSVIVHDGRIIGEGFHQKAGGPHAEVNAINSVSDKSLLKSSVLYVNLEPCSHFGKTPPCADMIISYSIPKVIIGTIDTSDKVSGEGVERLIDSGCKVVTGILEEECRRLNRRFFTYNEKKRPYITLKWAQSSDGYIDIKRSGNHKTRPTWITGDPERVLVHKWRSCEESILVGAGTVRADDPRLNVRDWSGRQPLRAVLSRSGLIDKYSALCRTNGTFIVFSNNTDNDLPDSVMVKLSDEQPASLQIADYLHWKGVQSLFIEGGAEVLNHFITTGLWDEARVFTGRFSFGEGIKAPVLNNNDLNTSAEFGRSKLEVFTRKEECDSIYLDKKN